MVASYLEFRGWIRRETLFGRSSVTFGLRQRVPGNDLALLPVALVSPSCYPSNHVATAAFSVAWHLRKPPSLGNDLGEAMRVIKGDLDAVGVVAW